MPKISVGIRQPGIMKCWSQVKMFNGPNPKKIHFPYVKNWYDYVILVANVCYWIKYGSRLGTAVYAGRKITSLET